MITLNDIGCVMLRELRDVMGSEFAEPIHLPNNVVALRQATTYISELPDAEQNSREWQIAANVPFKRRIKSAAPVFSVASSQKVLR